MPGIPGLRRAEGGHAVRDRLDPRPGDAAGGEGAEDQEQSQLVSPGRRGRSWRGDTTARCSARPDDGPPTDHENVEGDEGIGQGREKAPGLADPTQVRDRDPEHAEDAELDSIRIEGRHGGRGRGDSRGDAHRYREDVVGQQGATGHEAGIRAEVLAAHDVGPTRTRVGEDRLTVGADHDREE